MSEVRSKALNKFKSHALESILIGLFTGSFIGHCSLQKMLILPIGRNAWFYNWIFRTRVLQLKN